MEKLKIKANILFAGIGCQERGFEDSGVIDLEVVSISEIDKYAVCSYATIHKGLTLEMIRDYDEYPDKEEMVKELTEKNIGYDVQEGKPYDWERISNKNDDGFELKKNWLANNLSKNLGDINKIKELPQADLWTVSFPCTDISIAGKMRGFREEAGTRSSLLWQQIRLLRKALEDGTAPDYLLFENVKQLVHKFKEDFEELLDILSSLGYESYWKVMNAKDFGVPQSRERVFVLCIKRGAKCEGFTFPTPFACEKSLDDILCSATDVYESWDGRVMEYISKSIAEGNQPAINSDNHSDSLLTDEEKETETEKVGRGKYKAQTLTTQNCFILMGLTAEDAEKCERIGISKRQLYKQAGNGIVTKCIQLIAEHLYKAVVNSSFVCTDERMNEINTKTLPCITVAPDMPGYSKGIVDSIFTEDGIEVVQSNTCMPKGSYEESVTIIKNELNNMKESAIRVGWHLKNIKENGWYHDKGYKNIYELAEAEFGLGQSTTTRYMKLCTLFSKNNNSPEVDEKYQLFDKSKLIEMINMPPEVRENITPEMTTKEIQDIKKQVKREVELLKKTCYKSEEEWFEWLADVPSWGKWYVDKKIRAAYYKHDLPDGSRIVAVTYDYEAGKEDSGTYFYHMQFSDSYREKHEDGQFYPSCYTHETIEIEQIVDILMELQNEACEKELSGDRYTSNNFVLECLEPDKNEKMSMVAKKYRKFYETHGYIPKFFASKDGREVKNFARTLLTGSGAIGGLGSIIIFDPFEEIRLVDIEVKNGNLSWEEAKGRLRKILSVASPEEIERIKEVFKKEDV